MAQSFNTIDEAIEAVRAGEVVVIVDDEDRENEGDFVCAAEKTTPEIVSSGEEWYAYRSPSSAWRICSSA